MPMTEISALASSTCRVLIAGIESYDAEKQLANVESGE